jgi:hypothetical protein
MSKPKDGGPAFPTPAEPFLDGPQGKQPASAWGMEGKPGMSLRAWLAGMAMSNLVWNDTVSRIEQAAKLSVKMADALLAELEKETP